MTFKKLNLIKLSLLALVFLLNINDVQSQEQTIEDVIVSAEKEMKAFRLYRKQLLQLLIQNLKQKILLLL